MKNRPPAEAGRRPSSTASITHPTARRNPAGVRRVYLAAPVSLYDTGSYARALAGVRRRFPGAKIIDAAWAWRSTADWRARWPALLRRLGGLAFVTAAGGAVGLGVLSEIADAQRRLPVWRWAGGLRAVAPGALHVHLLAGGADWRRCVRIGGC